MATYEEPILIPLKLQEICSQSNVMDPVQEFLDFAKEKSFGKDPREWTKQETTLLMFFVCKRSCGPFTKEMFFEFYKPITGFGLCNMLINSNDMLAKAYELVIKIILELQRVYELSDNKFGFFKKLRVVLETKITSSDMNNNDSNMNNKDSNMNNNDSNMSVLKPLIENNPKNNLQLESTAMSTDSKQTALKREQSIANNSPILNKVEVHVNKTVNESGAKVLLRRLSQAEIEYHSTKSRKTTNDQNQDVSTDEYDISAKLEEDKLQGMPVSNVNEEEEAGKVQNRVAESGIISEDSDIMNIIKSSIPRKHTPISVSQSTQFSSQVSSQKITAVSNFHQSSDENLWDIDSMMQHKRLAV